jgi:Transcriptional regulator
MERRLYSEKSVYNLVKAFIELLNEKNYDSITVSDIAKKAGLNRTTFYLFYSNKAELARDICNTFLDEYMDIFMRFFGDGNKHEAKEIVKGSFHNLKKEKKMILGLWSIQESSFSPYILMQESIKRGILKHLEDRKLKIAQNGSADFFAELYAANVMATVKWWLTNEENYSFDYVYSSIIACSEKGILSLLEK